MDFDKNFEQRCRALEAFKRHFGHYNVPPQYSADRSLGNWCNAMRYSYRKIQQGKPAKRNLSQDRIKRLEEIGFKWKGVDFDKKFENRCLDLEAFKRKFGHCNVSRGYSAGPSLRHWCNFKLRECQIFLTMSE